MFRLLSVVALFCVAACVTEGEPDAHSKSSPRDAAEINYKLGSQYLRQGKLKLARKRLELAAKQDPKLPGPHTALAILFERTGQSERADGAYKQALRVAPDDANVQNAYAVFLCNGGQHAEGQKYFTLSARNLDNASPEIAFTNAGVCALQQPDKVAAEAHFRSALKRNSKYADALLHMAVLSYDSGEALKSRAFLERYSSGRKLTAEVLLLGVRIEKALGNTDAMNKYVRRLVRDYPDSAEARMSSRIVHGR